MKILCVQHKFHFAWLSSLQLTRLIITFLKSCVSEGAIYFICLNTMFLWISQVTNDFLDLILQKFDITICITYCIIIDIFLLMSLPSMYTKASILFHSVPQDEVGLALLFFSVPLIWVTCKYAWAEAHTVKASSALLLLKA